MKQFRKLLENYLDEIGRLQPLVLGDEKTQKSPTTENSDFLNVSLSNQLASTKWLEIMYIAMLCILFSIGVFLVFYYLNFPEKIAVVFGGTFLSMLAIADRLRRLWHEKSMMNLLVILIGESEPESLAKIVEVVYWNILKR